jgi:prevent-host-death family protein
MSPSGDDELQMAPVRTIPISEFKRNCSAILRRGQKTRALLVITRFGKPIAEVISLPKTRPGNWLGSMRGSGEILGDIVSPANQNND